jgi:hypothetical protein
MANLNCTVYFRENGTSKIYSVEQAKGRIGSYGIRWYEEKPAAKDHRRILPRDSVFMPLSERHGGSPMSVTTLAVPEPQEVTEQPKDAEHLLLRNENGRGRKRCLCPPTQNSSS